MMRHAPIIVVLFLVSPASAAPWSFELPAGYSEVPGGADGELEQLRAVPRTVSADAQVYLSPDGRVRLTRMTWLSSFDVTPTRGNLVSLDKGVAAGGSKHGKVTREAREIVGDQLVGEQVIDIEATRVQMRRIYAADRNRVVTMFTVVCAGPEDALAACDRAQQTMRLVLPNQASLTGSPPQRRGTAYVAGYVAGSVLVALGVVWLVLRMRRRRT
jgi:hypothetical protein